VERYPGFKVEENRSVCTLSRSDTCTRTQKYVAAIICHRLLSNFSVANR